jgi:hypothetical protein
VSVAILEIAEILSAAPNFLYIKLDSGDTDKRETAEMDDGR